jgi:Pyridoxal-dependent decarboxylase conserved domain
VEHPLAMDVEAMRRAGYATVDALVARLADPEADPVLRRAGAAGMRARLGGPPPEQPGDYGTVLARVLADVLPFAARTDHPGYLAFIPSFTTWPAALAELTAAAANPYCGAWLESAGPAQVELEVIDWFRGWLGLPAGTAGVLVNGGSAANLTALLVAREAVGGPSPLSVVYVSDQAHSSLARTARAMGLRPEQVRVLPTDGRWRLAPDTVAAAVRADRDADRIPFALCASAGSTNTGAVDPLAALADVCAAEGLWLHVDAAYGGFAALTARGKALLAGLERADSVTLDPHKWLYQPMECGCVLIRDGARLERTFAIHPDYLDGDAVRRGRDRTPRHGARRRPGARRHRAGLRHPAGRAARHPPVHPEPDHVGGARAAGHRALRRCPRPGAARAGGRGGGGHQGSRPGPAGRGPAAGRPARRGPRTGSSTSSWPGATTSSSTAGSSAATAPVTTSASSPRATGAAALATPGSPLSAAPNRACC